MSLDLEFPILLPGGGVFRFAGTFPMPYEPWQHIRRVMDAMTPGLVTANEDSNRAHLQLPVTSPPTKISRPALVQWPD